MAITKRHWPTNDGESEAWVLRYYDAERKYRTKTFETKRAAEAWEAQMRVDKKKGIHRPDSTSLKIRELWPLLLETCKAEAVEPEAIDKYEQHLRIHVFPAATPKSTPNGWDGELGDLKVSRLRFEHRGSLVIVNWHRTAQDADQRFQPIKEPFPPREVMKVARQPAQRRPLFLPVVAVPRGVDQGEVEPDRLRCRPASFAIILFVLPGARHSDCDTKPLQQLRLAGVRCGQQGAEVRPHRHPHSIVAFPSLKILHPKSDL